jgi:hypothetical protein
MNKGKNQQGEDCRHVYSLSRSAILPHLTFLDQERKVLNIMIKGANKCGAGYILNWLELPFLYDRESGAILFVPRNFFHSGSESSGPPSIFHQHYAQPRYSHLVRKLLDPTFHTYAEDSLCAIRRSPLRRRP